MQTSKCYVLCQQSIKCTMYIHSIKSTGVQTVHRIALTDTYLSIFLEGQRYVFNIKKMLSSKFCFYKQKTTFTVILIRSSMDSKTQYKTLTNSYILRHNLQYSTMKFGWCTVNSLSMTRKRNLTSWWCVPSYALMFKWGTGNAKNAQKGWSKHTDTVVK